MGRCVIFCFLIFRLKSFNFQSVTSNDLIQTEVYKPAFLMDLSAGPTVASLGNSSFTYIVVDPDAVRLTQNDIENLRSRGKILLAYLSIGEAEVKRDYWGAEWVPGVHPKFLEHVNPDMKDRVKVFFWMPDWQGTLLKYMRTHILRKGFSGIYLDALDSYRYFLLKTARNTAADDMISLILNLRQSAQATQPDILLFANNAPELYDSSAFANTVDGLVAQSVWYLGDSFRDESEFGRTNFTLQFLRRARNDAKMVLVADFPTSHERICDFYVKCSVDVFHCAVFDDIFGGKGRTC